jgi:hypothetical protein
MADVAGITYVHSVQYFGKGIDANGPYYRVEYQIEDWANADEFANALLGISTYTGFIDRVGPHRHPLSSNLVCTTAVVSGRGRPTKNAEGTPQYASGAIIQAEYRSPAVGGGSINVTDEPGLAFHIDPSSGPILWCTQECDFGVELITLNNHQSKFVSDNKPVKVPIQIRIPIITLALTFHRVPYLPISLLRTKVGKINDATFLGCDAFTVAFDGARTIKEVQSNGQQSRKIALNFSWRPYSWNRMLRDDKLPTDTNAWDLITSPTGGSRYEPTDLSPLVRL